MNKDAAQVYRDDICPQMTALGKCPACGDARSEEHSSYRDRRSLIRLFQSHGLVLVDHEIFGIGRDFVKVIDGSRRKREGVVPTDLKPGTLASIVLFDVAKKGLPPVTPVT